MKKSIDRFNKVMEIARGMAKNSIQATNQLEEIRLFADDKNAYVEPGYNGKLVVLGDYNEPDVWDNEAKERKLCLPEHPDLFHRISEIFEALGIECEWHDEWSDCQECGKVFRSEPDSYFWKRYFVYDRGGYSCLKCKEEEEEEEDK